MMIMVMMMSHDVIMTVKNLGASSWLRRRMLLTMSDECDDGAMVPPAPGACSRSFLIKLSRGLLVVMVDGRTII
jgi:hypothetical protein